MSELNFNPSVSPGMVLSNYEVCKTKDIEEACFVGKKILCTNNLKVNSRDRSIEASIFYRKVGGVGLGRMSYGANVVVEPDVFEDFLLVQMPIRGSEEVVVGGDKVLCSPEVFGIINSSSKAEISHNYNTEKLIVRIDKSLLNRSCQNILGFSISKDVEFESMMPLGKNNCIHWLQLVSWIYGVVSSQDVLSPLIVSQIENSLANVLLVNQPNNYSDFINGEGVSVSPFFIKKIDRYIQENADKPITINDMAEHAGVSCRTLYNGFRKYKNITPMRYLKEIRLQNVYEELKCAHIGSDTVTEIAFKWGFSHLGHFSQDYKSRFYETPSETLLR